MAAGILLLAAVHAGPPRNRPPSGWLLPIDAPDRRSLAGVRLTPIGAFGLPRKARREAPAHLHAGLDFARPGRNHADEPVFPIGPGEVISLRDDGPFAQIMVAHPSAAKARLWSVYEHVAGIRVRRGDKVTPEVPMARFMTRAELKRHGWQFDHLHLEILKAPPRALKPAPRTPDRLFGSYNLECHDASDLEARYHDPRMFLDSVWRR